MNKLMFLVFTLQIFCLEAIAQVVASPAPVGPAIPQAAGILAGGATPGQWLLDIVAKFPKLATLLFIVGGLRLTLKPIFSFLHTFFQGWGLTSWDQAETNFETSKAMKVIYFILDYLGSVKLPVKDDTTPPPGA